MTDWIFRATQNFSNVSDAVDFSAILSRQTILVSLESPQKRPTWYKAGNVIQVIDTGIVPVLCEVSDSYSYLGFNPTLLRFQILSGNNYKLRFNPVPWLSEFSISIWQYYGIALYDSSPESFPVMTF
jgi:hypothetical protein